MNNFYDKVNSNEPFPIEVKSVFSKSRNDTINTNGWGFKDSYFTTKNGCFTFAGDRYLKSSINESEFFLSSKFLH